ncbi:predicted protein [Naegleria gruberi]|uniref:Predicted protein n=1 Tax=Naegleria gruberi TaxID=5762 RepID=D2VXB9_NAEGR|nr:uncharacterized protein NAEGRDRAFT_73691 [Naegleria gruberi]EFC38479.1 predicted protein [Naegleria gruberi]|eukprot:XP_002671223.1 predicted protein [Naegleria gruberi strain NEG-M]
MDNLIMAHSSMRVNVIFIPKIIGEINLNVNLQFNNEILSNLIIKSIVFSTEFENNQLIGLNTIRNILILDEFGKQTISKLDFGEFFKGQTSFKLITLRNQSSTDTFDVFFGLTSNSNNSNNNNSNNNNSSNSSNNNNNW